MEDQDLPKKNRGRFGIPLVIVLVIVLVVAGVVGLRKSAISQEFRRAKQEMASQIEEIKAGARRTFARIDPRFIGDILKDSECVEKLEELSLFMSEFNCFP